MYIVEGHIIISNKYYYQVLLYGNIMNNIISTMLAMGRYTFVYAFIQIVIYQCVF